MLAALAKIDSRNEYVLLGPQPVSQQRSTPFPYQVKTVPGFVANNENMAKVLARKKYHYQFVFARNAGHVEHSVVRQTLPEALEYVWQGYSGNGKH